jgi:ankyrin repeat protein
MRICLVLIGLVAVGFGTVHGQGSRWDPALAAAVREGDTSGVRRLLRARAPLDGRDANGATVLMHTAAFSTPEIVRLLLDRGADPNASDTAGATALIWGTHDPEIVQLLTERGADVNAGRSDGITPLISAALRGRTDVMRLLRSAGADPRAGSVNAPWPMTLARIALTTNDSAMREFLDRRDITPERLSEWTPKPMAAWLVTSIFSWRPQPEASHAWTVRTLLDSGADPDERVAQMTLSVPLLTRVVLSGDVEVMQLLLARGANPNASGDRSLTPLMAAAVTDPAGRMVRQLLDAGALVTPLDEHRRTALDWALRLGETRSAALLRQAGAQASGQPVAPPRPVAVPRGVGDAMSAALDRLEPAGPEFYTKTKCISCHNQSLPAIAARRAAERDRREPAVVSHATQATLEAWGRGREHMLAGHCAVMGFMPNAAYGLFALAEERVAPGPVTDAVASCLSGLQRPDGSWVSGDQRPPISARGPVVYTALAMRAIQTYLPPGRRAEARTRAQRAMRFLRAAAPADTQDHAFRLLGLSWGAAPRSEIADQQRRLLARQRKDGGWSQLPTMESDAYATGQSLYALAVSGMAATSTTFRNGADYLRRTQLQDGTWYVRSRAVGFQPYVDSGFPHGPDQFISSAATSWAVMALSFTP